MVVDISEELDCGVEVADDARGYAAGVSGTVGELLSQLMAPTA